jgi:hypothetical protein
MAPPVNGGSPALVAPERNNFFYGKLMDVGEWQKDQRHFDFKRSLLNRLSLGSGVACGLAIEPAAEKHVRLQPGVALDGWGREIVVSEGLTFDPFQLTDDAGEAVGDSLASGLVEIRLAYAENRVDPVPVVAPDCDNPGPCAPSTIRETFRVLVRKAEGEPPDPLACGFPDLPLDDPAEFQQHLVKRLADACGEAPADPSVALGQVSLDDLSIDLTAGRKPAPTNALLFELIVCLAARVAALEP